MRQEIGPERKINVVYYFRIINRYKWKILTVAAIASLIAYVNTVRKPDVFRVITSVIRPEAGNYISAAVRNSQILPSLSSAESANFVNLLITHIIRSRRSAEDIVDEFGLDKKWGIPYDNAAVAVRDMINVHGEGAGLNLWIDGRDPVLMADILNFAVKNLDAMNEELKLTTEKPLVTVLDEARVPLRPLPKYEGRNAIAVFILTAFIMMLAVFFREYLKDIMEEERRSTIEGIARDEVYISK